MSDRQTLIRARIEEGYPPAAAANMSDVEMNENAARRFDCGIDAWGFEEDGAEVHEDYYVSNELWDRACPDDRVVRWMEEDGTELAQGRFVLCVGCLERRLGRTPAA